jgi:hypothetical protein
MEPDVKNHWTIRGSNQSSGGSVIFVMTQDFKNVYSNRTPNNKPDLLKTRNGIII